MSLVIVNVDTSEKKIIYELKNLHFRYFDVEFIFTDNSQILDITFGYSIKSDDLIICERSFDENFAYRRFEKVAYFNTSRVEKFNNSQLAITAFCSHQNFYFEDTHIINLPIPEKPFYSWILGSNGWEPPIPIPSDEYSYRWNENDMTWIKVEWSESLREWIDI